MKQLPIAGIAAAFVGLMAPDVSAQARYTLTPLASLGEPGGEAFAVNQAGRTAGSSFTRFEPCGGGLLCSYVHAVLWGGDGAVHEIHTIVSGNISATLDLNNAGQAVGQAGYQAFLWQDGFMSILPSLGGPGSNGAMAVNDAGLIAGWSDDPSGEHRAVLWQDGEILELGTYAEGTESFAEDINEAGQIVGTATLVGSLTYTRRATLWHDGTMINLGTLPEGMGSRGVAINEIGQVVGWSWDTVLNRRRAVLWRRNPLTGEWAIADLGGLTADGTSRADDINNRGQIVGQAECIGYCGRAFLWENGTMFDPEAGAQHQQRGSDRGFRPGRRGKPGSVPPNPDLDRSRRGRRQSRRPR